MLTAAPFAQNATFRPLGDLSGGSFLSFATDVSSGGIAVGAGRMNEGWKGFRLNGTSLQSLGQLGNNNAQSIAYGISDNGLVIVGASERSSSWEAFRYTNGQMTSIGDLAGGATRSYARGISGNGNVIVGQGTTTAGTESFRWTSASGMVPLGDLPGGSVLGEAYGASFDGTYIVGYSSGVNGNEAFRWTATGLQPLGDLPGGVFASYAYGVCEDGDVVVGQGTSSQGAEAFFWTEESGMVSLGDLPGGAVNSIAYDLTAEGNLVVGQASTDVGEEAFLWTSSMGMLNLKQYLIDNGATGLQGWTLYDCQAVSPNGTMFVGVGVNPRGEGEAWIATINPLPEVQSLEFDPAVVTGGANTAALLNLSAPAPAGGVTVTLTDNSSVIDTPPTVFIPAGASSATFTVTTIKAVEDAVRSVTATLNDLSVTSNLTVLRIRGVASLNVSPSTIVGGQSGTATVTLDQVAGGAGSVVAVSDNSGAITTPDSLTVPANEITGTFTVGTAQTTTAYTRQVTARSGDSSRTVSVTVIPECKLMTLSVSPNAVYGGSTTNGAVTLTWAAPAGGATVLVSDNTSVITTPSSVDIAEGATSASFSISTASVNSAVTRQVTASYNGVSKTANLTLNPVPRLTSITLNPTTVKGGQSVNGAVVLSPAAGADGAVVALADNTSVIQTPSSVTLAAGSQSAGFWVTTSPVASTATRQITATYNGVTKTANLTLTP